MGTQQDCPWSLDTVPVRGKKDDISEVPLVLYVVEDAAKPLLNSIIPDFITTFGWGMHVLYIVLAYEATGIASVRTLDGREPL